MLSSFLPSPTLPLPPVFWSKFQISHNFIHSIFYCILLSFLYFKCFIIYGTLICRIGNPQINTRFGGYILNTFNQRAIAVSPRPSQIAGIFSQQPPPPSRCNAQASFGKCLRDAFFPLYTCQVVLIFMLGFPHKAVRFHVLLVPCGMDQVLSLLRSSPPPREGRSAKGLRPD